MPQDAPLTFFEHPILNSPYAYPGRHWVVFDSGWEAEFCRVADDFARLIQQSCHGMPTLAGAS